MDKSRLTQLKRWLDDELDLDSYNISLASVDASFRSYYRITQGVLSYIVMDAPPEKEDCAGFIDISTRLSAINIHVPEVIASELDNGFLLLSDLGDCSYLQALEKSGTLQDTLYMEAIKTLVKFQLQTSTHKLPPYNAELLADEITLFFDWLVDVHLKIPITSLPWKEALYELLIDNALSQPKVFVHRDYHTRNLMVCKNNNPGILDFQDAVLGPLTYDIVSLLKDCYIKWPIAYQQRLFQEYLNALNELTIMRSINDRQMQNWFDLMGVQRHMKASGIFARLWHRYGKAGYLKEIPRTLSYILALKNDYPALQDFCQFIDDQLLPKLAEPV